jgi:hypothetical protein
MMNTIDNHKATIYQTKHYKQSQINNLQNRADGQEKAIARHYWRYPNRKFGPAELHKIFFPDAPNQQGWDLNSTRRSITNLTDDDILVKTDETCSTYRGGTEHKWRWKHPEDFEASAAGQGEMFSRDNPAGILGEN